MNFSHRLRQFFKDGSLHSNALARIVAEKRRSGTRIIDLTESNPTRAGIRYPDFLGSLAAPGSLLYEPEPFGLLSAREIVAREYQIPVERIVLTASTSEAYSWLFKLLCDPGDKVLIPHPSYPLFEYLAALESVRVAPYGLFYDYGWFIDFHTIEQALDERTRVIVLVNPNNPTGHFIRKREAEELVALAARHSLAIISDEVFRDYALRPKPDSMTSVQSIDAALVFTLNGLSKTVGLPQMKLAWMIANGPPDVVSEALARLEIVADTYLSVGAPVQHALGSLLELRGAIQQQIGERTRANLALLCSSGLRTLEVEAGWYAVVVLGSSVSEDDFVAQLLQDSDVLVQPGYFFDFERSGYVVLSLLTEPDIFREGVERITKSLS